MSSKEIQSVGGFLDIIDSISKEHVTSFFRGQSDIAWEIESSIMRRNTALEKEYLAAAKKAGNLAVNPDFAKLEFTRRIHRQFVDSYPTFPEVHLLKGYALNDIDMMMVSQHYGLPTRLIDWSLNPMIALYFATEENPDTDNSDACVFSLSDTSTHSTHISFSNSQSLLNTIERERQVIKKLITMRDQLFAPPTPPHTIDLSYDIVNETIFSPQMSIGKVINSHQIQMLLTRLTIEAGPDKGIRTAEFARQALSDTDIGNALQGNCAINFTSRGHFFIKPLPLNQRIKNQQGVFQFSQSPFNRDPLNDLISDTGESETSTPLKLIRIKIPAAHKKRINRELARYGITKDFVYPEIDRFTAEMTKNTASELIHNLGSA